MMYPMAPSPSSSGISRSIVTRSGTSLWILRSASSPSRATPTTWNSPDASMISVRMRRKSALSSTTRTVGRSDRFFTGAEGADHQEPVLRLHPDRAADGPAGGLRRDRDAVVLQHLPGGDDVPLPHLHRPRGGEVAEHRRPADEAGGDAALVGPQRGHVLQQERHRRLREL